MEQSWRSRSVRRNRSSSLDVGESAFDGGHGVGHGEVGVVMGVDAQLDGEALAHIRADAASRVSSCRVGVAEADDVGAGVLGGLNVASAKSGWHPRRRRSARRCR